MKAKKHHAAWVAGLALAAGLAWWLQRPAAPVASSTPVPAAGTQGPVGVEVAQARQQALVDDAQAVGTLVSRQSVNLRPEVGGRVVEIAFADGAQVRQGQLLVRLDDVLQRAELSQAQAQLSVARANHQRNQELVAQNFVARRVLDESQAALQVAEAQVQLAQARLARMRLVAPFAGVVGIRNVHLGDYVKDGADLVHIEDSSTLFVDFRLPERYQARIGRGQTVQVHFDALPGQTFAAQVRAVDPLLDANGRSLLVRAELDRSASLRPGMFARVNVVFATIADAVMLPEAAIVPQGDKPWVFRLEPAEGGGAVAHRTAVELGARQNGLVQVLQGIQAGDQVVVAGQQRLRGDTVPVRVVQLPGTPEAAAPTSKEQP